MKLTVIGAAHEVTGSCSYLDVCGKKILVDYGMEQGSDTYINIPLPVAAAQIDYVLLTHAHIDHSGLLPLLYKEGFCGEIHATEATASLCSIMLRDSAHIQEFEAEWRNRKAQRSGGQPYIPLYGMGDAEGAIGLFRPHPYSQRFTLAEGIEARFIDAGHLWAPPALSFGSLRKMKRAKSCFPVILATRINHYCAIRNTFCTRTMW